MTQSTTIYIGGEGYTIGQLLRDMRTAPPGSLIAQYRANQIRGAMIKSGDFPKDICDEIDAILKEKGEPPLTIGSLNNQQAGLVCPRDLVNYVFRKGVQLNKMWEWIRDHFLVIHRHDYDWFALLQFLAHKGMLSKGMATTNPSFAKQMEEWFPSYKCSPNNMKLYRTGYLGETHYSQWNRARFSQLKRAGQTLDGYDILDRMCNTDLALSYDEDSSAFILEESTSI